MNNFTPGPWEVDGQTVYALESAGFYRGLERFQNRFDAQVQSPRASLRSELEANARLMAAAPDLLEALEETRKDLVVLRGNITDAAKSCSMWEGMPELIDAWIRRNDEAITRARGES